MWLRIVSGGAAGKARDSTIYFRYSSFPLEGGPLSRDRALAGLQGYRSPVVIDLIHLEYSEAESGTMPTKDFDQQHILLNLNEHLHLVENWRSGDRRVKNLISAADQAAVHRTKNRTLRVPRKRSRFVDRIIPLRA